MFLVFPHHASFFYSSSLINCVFFFPHHGLCWGGFSQSWIMFSFFSSLIGHYVFPLSSSWAMFFLDVFSALAIFFLELLRERVPLPLYYFYYCVFCYLRLWLSFVHFSCCLAYYQYSLVVAPPLHQENVRLQASNSFRIALLYRNLYRNLFMTLISSVLSPQPECSLERGKIFVSYFRNFIVSSV